MLSVLGLGLLAAGLLLLDGTAAWLMRRHDGMPSDRWPLADLFTIVITSLLIVGGSMLFADIIESWSSGHAIHALVAILATVALAAVGRVVSTWARRRPV